MDLADLLEGAGERVKVSSVLVASLPQAEDDRRRTLLLREVAQVSEEEHTKSSQGHCQAKCFMLLQIWTVSAVKDASHSESAG